MDQINRKSLHPLHKNKSEFKTQQLHHQQHIMTNKNIIHLQNQHIHQEIVKQLTIKNQILTQQLNQYKILVQNLQIKIQQLTVAQNQHFINENNVLFSFSQNNKKYSNNQLETGKLQTIEEQLNSLSDIATNSRRKTGSDKEQILLNQFWKIITENNPQQQNQNDSTKVCWQLLFEKIQKMKNELKELRIFVENIWLMRDKIEPSSQSTLVQLWNWLKILGSNYRTILSYYNLCSTESYTPKMVKQMHKYIK